MHSDNPWTIKSSKIVYKNPWMSVREDSVITPTGVAGIYGVMESRNSVMIIVMNSNDEIYLIRTFAYPAASWNWELPGGGGDDERPLEASKRELKEETGVLAEEWNKLGETRVCNGFMTERMTTYLARDLSFTDEREVGDERIDMATFFSMEKVDDMIEKGEINDGQSITGIHLAQKWLIRMHDR